ncbi:MAG: excinuclease ABC subunit UvrA [Armatimonadetes bacterium]|nr:excinuclease ABC subunit UvrA [Armatimonadota bacterium]
MEPMHITIRGAQQHNLKNVSVTIPRYKLVVLTGVSGSGKSSLAFDTIYAEGQRRYVESLSAYARQFLGQMEKPRVDYIGGLSPAIAIEQKTVSRNPRSTVGTVTEVMDYLRVLYARFGTAHCPRCGRKVESQSAQQIADQLATLPPGTRFQILAPIVRQRKGTHLDVVEQAVRDGYSRARIDGVPTELAASAKLAKTKQHTIELIVDRLRVPDEPDSEEMEEFRIRLGDSVETTLKAGGGILIADLGEGKETVLSEQNACPHCDLSFPSLSPQVFSFNSPAGMCPVCNGLGTTLKIDLNLIVQNPDISILDGALRWYGSDLRKAHRRGHLNHLQTIADHYGVDLELAWKDLPEPFRNVLLYGSGEEKIRFAHKGEWRGGSWSHESVHVVGGIVQTIEYRFKQTKSEGAKSWYTGFMSQQPCSECEGTRLRPEARAVTVGGRTISQVGAMSIAEAHNWIENVCRQAESGPDALTAEQMNIASEVLKEIRDRLRFMLNVGLHYLTLDRPAPSLSGGEGQRIRLACQIGCGLVGVLYILDEPSVGLHARDNRALLDTLLQLRDMGNTVLVVEHDAETMHSADWIIDLGPGAGVIGGEVVADGPPRKVAANPMSLTGRYLSGEMAVNAPNGSKLREPSGAFLTVAGARMHNLKSIDARFPVGLLTCVTGVSGSGKSSLVAHTLFPALDRALMGAQGHPGPHDRLEGLEHLDKVINITQEPIGRTPRSNPATYVGLFDDIRQVFASTPEAKSRGYKPSRFSFNVKGGRCEVCKGHGKIRIEMHFLADAWVTCKECGGTRFNRETLDIRYKGKNIAEALDMDVQGALDFFERHPTIARILRTLHDVGLDYVKLGQSATTLSGGEAQRVKLAKELSRIATGRTVYILDEPTTGLHFADVQRLLDVLHRLTDAGNTVIVVEHNLDVIKTADWLIDLGPEGGTDGGLIVAEGPPEAVIRVRESYTGQFLQRYLEEAYRTVGEGAVLSGLYF